MDLKPCPFCGGKPELVDLSGAAFVRCSGCCETYVSPNHEEAAETWNRRAIPPEPRTCETCAEYGRDDADCNGDRTGMECIDRSNWKSKAFHSPQSADVETVREKIELAIKFGLPIDARMALKEALAALDRIVGVLRG